MDTPKIDNEKAAALKAKQERKREYHFFKIFNHVDKTYRFFFSADGAKKPRRSISLESSFLKFWRGIGFTLSWDDNRDEMFQLAIQLGIMSLYLSWCVGYRNETSIIHNPKWRPQRWGFELFNSWQVFDVELGYNSNTWRDENNLWGKHNEKARFYLTYETVMGGWINTELPPKVLAVPQTFTFTIPAYKTMKEMEVTATVKETRCKAGFKFWFKEEYQRLQIDLAENGQVVPVVNGKGENSWDCDPDEVTNISFHWIPQEHGDWKKAASQKFIAHVKTMVDKRGVA